MDAMLPPGALRGRNTIIVDDWGPYDYQSPKIWPVGKLAAGERLEVAGDDIRPCRRGS